MCSTFTQVMSSALFKPVFCFFCFLDYSKGYSFHYDDVSLTLYILQLLTALLRHLLLFKMTVCIRRTRKGTSQILCDACVFVVTERGRRTGKCNLWATTVWLHLVETKYKSWSKHLDNDF